MPVAAGFIDAFDVEAYKKVGRPREVGFVYAYLKARQVGRADDFVGCVAGTA